MSEWYASLDGFLDEVWQRLACGVADRGAAARHPVLATAGQTGGAEARIVVLRAVDRRAGRVEVHTDTASDKIAELTRDPRATLLIWDENAQLQIRLRVRAKIRTGPTEGATWDRVPETSRMAYGVMPLPATPIPASDAYARQADPARFAVLRCTVEEIEAVVLAPDHHRRAIWARADSWAGGWRAP